MAKICIESALEMNITFHQWLHHVSEKEHGITIRWKENSPQWLFLIEKSVPVYFSDLFWVDCLHNWGAQQ